MGKPVLKRSGIYPGEFCHKPQCQNVARDENEIDTLGKYCDYCFEWFCKDHGVFGQFDDDDTILFQYCTSCLMQLEKMYKSLRRMEYEVNRIPEGNDMIVHQLSHQIFHLRNLIFKDHRNLREVLGSYEFTLA